MLFSDLEKQLLKDAISPKVRENMKYDSSISLEEPKLCILDVTKGIDAVATQLSDCNFVTTNPVLLLEDSATKKWIALSFIKKYYLLGASNCLVDLRKYAAKRQVVPEEMDQGLFFNAQLEGALDSGVGHLKVTPAKFLAEKLLKDTEKFAQKGYTSTYVTLDDARSGNAKILDQSFSQVKQRLKLQDDPKYHQAVEELRSYVETVISDLQKEGKEVEGKKLQSISINFEVFDWAEHANNPYRAIAKDAKAKLSFKPLKMVDIDPSSDNGTYTIEFVKEGKRKTDTIFHIGYSAQPTGELDNRLFQSDLVKIELDAVTYFVD